MICFTEYPSPLGTLLLAATDHGLCGVYFEQHKYFDGPASWQHSTDHPHLVDAMRQLDEYFAGKRQDFALSLALAGTPFQYRVWQELLALPFGCIDTYAAIARRIDRPHAVRAVGSAIGRNPVSIIVPCHRVLGTSGTLSGYAGGLQRKQYLLAHEGVTAIEERRKSGGAGITRAAMR